MGNVLFVLLTTSASLSVFGSISLILCFFLFRELQLLLRNRLVFGLAVSDLILAAGCLLIWAHPLENSFVCGLQSFSLEFGTTSSHVFALLLSLDYLCTSKGWTFLKGSFFLCSLIATAVSLIPALLGFILHDFGVSGPWCWIRELESDAGLGIGSYIVWIGIDFVVCIILLHILYSVRASRRRASPSSPSFSSNILMPLSASLDHSLLHSVATISLYEEDPESRLHNALSQHNHTIDAVRTIRASSSFDLRLLWYPAIMITLFAPALLNRVLGFFNRNEQSVLMYQIQAFLVPLTGFLNAFVWGYMEKLVAPTFLQDGLKDEFVCECFNKFLRSQFCAENLDFWLESDQFSKIQDGSARSAKAHYLIQRYIAEGSQFEVNISSDVRHDILDMIEANEITTDLFQRAREEIFYLLDKFSWPNFLASKNFEYMIHELKMKSASGSRITPSFLWKRLWQRSLPAPTGLRGRKNSARRASLVSAMHNKHVQ